MDVSFFYIINPTTKHPITPFPTVPVYEIIVNGLIPIKLAIVYLFRFLKSIIPCFARDSMHVHNELSSNQNVK